MVYAQGDKVNGIAQDVLDYLRQYELSAGAAKEVLEEAIRLVPFTAKISPIRTQK